MLKTGGLVCISDFLITNTPKNIERYNVYNSINSHLPYGVFQLDDETPPFRHHNSAWIKRLTEPFKTLCYNEEVFPTMSGGTNNGFLYIGQLEEENVTT